LDLNEHGHIIETQVAPVKGRHYDVISGDAMFLSGVSWTQWFAPPDPEAAIWTGNSDRAGKTP
jgi:hypothetical protein